MSFTELIAGVEDHEKRLTVFNADEETIGTLREQFHDRNVSVLGERTPSGKPEAFTVLSADEEFVAAADIETVLSDDEDDRSRLRGRRLPADPRSPRRDDVHLLRHRADGRRLPGDRGSGVAGRKGTLHSGFQKLSILEGQMDIYEQLAQKGTLEVHAYAIPDTDVPEHDTDLTIHVERSDEIGRSWFVAYDGAGVDVNKCALLAEEREPRSFYGFWTYDPSTVDWIIDHLESTYGLLESH